MAFWFWQRLCRARPVLWLWNECRKRSQQRQLAIYCRRRESKMEIPVKCLKDDKKYPIQTEQGTDYRYRLIMPKSTWVNILSALAKEQTWSNFKDEAQKFERKNKQSRDYVDALHDIWSVMHWLQVREGLVASPPRKVTHGKR
jgi:hypothetical protein